MTKVYIVGIDPGPTPGIVGLWLEQRTDSSMHRFIESAEIMQCSLSAFSTVVSGIRISRHVRIVAAERFVVASRAGRSAHAEAGATTRDVLARLRAWANLDSSTFIERNASEVKAWATDARLDAAGLLAATVGMRHARDAARHALFCAVRDCGVVDPLSKHAKQPI